MLGRQSGSMRAERGERQKRGLGGRICQSLSSVCSCVCLATPRLLTQSPLRWDVATWVQAQQSSKRKAPLAAHGESPLKEPRHNLESSFPRDSWDLSFPGEHNLLTKEGSRQVGPTVADTSNLIGTGNGNFVFGQEMADLYFDVAFGDGVGNGVKEERGKGFVQRHFHMLDYRT